MKAIIYNAPASLWTSDLAVARAPYMHELARCDEHADAARLVVPSDEARAQGWTSFMDSERTN